MPPQNLFVRFAQKFASDQHSMSSTSGLNLVHMSGFRQSKNVGWTNAPHA